MLDPIEGPRQFVVFRLHAREYAFPIGQAIEVLYMVALTPLPEAPGWLPGMINMRGRVIPVMDLRTRLGLPQRTPDLNTAIIVAQAEYGVVGLIADAVVEILALPSESIATPDALAGATHTVASVAHVGDRLIVILDVHALCAGADRMLPAA
jgi:purine-binding chemotaxis protein CheW